MMGFGPMGGGAGGNFSSSSSSLSASAPPFTVDRLNPKPNSNPVLHYSDPPYVEPFSHTWQYGRPSAPRPEMGIDSTEINGVPIADDYRFSASASISPSSTQWSALSSVTKASGSAFGYGSEVEPYHSPYVPPMIGEDGLLVENEGTRYNVGSTSGLSVKSQSDYTSSLFDIEYGPRWLDDIGFDGGKRSKRVELDGSFSFEKASVGGSHHYNYQLNQGGRGTENWNKSKEDSGISYKKINRVSDREVYTGSSSVGRMEDKSCLEQNFGFFPYDSNTHVPSSASNHPESHPSVLSSEMHKNFSNFQNSYSPYEKCIRPVGMPFNVPASVVRSSPTVVIRPPPPTNSNLGQSIVSREPARSDNVGGAHSVDFDRSNPLKPKDSSLKPKDSSQKPSSEIKEHSFGANLFNIPKQGNSLVLSASAKQLPSPLPSMDTFDRNVKGRFGSQLPNINIPGGFSTGCDNVQVVPSEGSSGFMDLHNPAVDSPCWKGAPSSQFSAFDIEAGSSNYVKKNLDEYYEFDREKHQNLNSIVDSISEKVEGNKKIENECTNGVVLALERTLDAIRSSKEQSSLDDVRGCGWMPTTVSSKGAETSHDLNMLREESSLNNNLMSGFDNKVPVGEAGAGLTLNDVSEGGAVAVHAAEKVLASPASQEDAAESTKLSDRNLNHATEKILVSPTSQEDPTKCNTLRDPTLNVPTMIKAIHNLSELLLFHLSNDAYSLEEENTETIKNIMSNLESCLSKKSVPVTNKPEPTKHVGSTTEKLGESCNVGTKEAVSSPTKLDDCHNHEEEKRYSFSGKKDETSPLFSPLMDDLDITRDDDMAKSIKKVLEDNFHFDEEMHSQALLFKNLWLEAEAKLCSISYKARFDRMRTQMEEVKLKAPQPQENEDLGEMMSKFFISPITASELAPRPHDASIPKPTVQNTTSGHADDVDTSVMARFSILKSREDKIQPTNAELEQEQEPEMVDGIHADSIMARFSILKSREENSKLISTEEEQQEHETIDGEFAGEKYLRFSEDETLNAALKPQTGNLSGGKFASYGYESLNEFHLSATDDPMIHSFNNSRLNTQNNWGWQDSSSSSDWEHVVKDDFSWKNV